MELRIKIILISICTPHKLCGLFNYTLLSLCKMNASPWQEGWDLTGMWISSLNLILTAWAFRRGWWKHSLWWSSWPWEPVSTEMLPFSSLCVLSDFTLNRVSEKAGICWTEYGDVGNWTKSVLFISWQAFNRLWVKWERNAFCPQHKLLSSRTLW